MRMRLGRRKGKLLSLGLWMFGLFLFSSFLLIGMAPGQDLSSNPQEEENKREFDFIPEGDEIIYARRIAAGIEEEADVIKNESLNDFLDGIGRRIIDQNNLRELVGDWEWSFRIIDTPGMNAFITLGGQVFMSRGLVEAVETESELAAVLAFELGHLASRHIHQHIFERLSRQSDFSPEETITGERGWEILSRIFMLEGGILAFFSGLRHNSIQVEKADELSLLSCYNAEYNPQDFLILLSRIGRRERPLSPWLRRNPWSETRRREMSSSLSMLPSSTFPTEPSRFREFKSLLRSLDSLSLRRDLRTPQSGREIFQDVTVMGNMDWTDTGVEVYEGQEISFQAFGTIYLQKGNPARCSPDGYDLRTMQQPFPDRNIGALIGKVAVLISMEVDEESGKETRYEIKEKFFIGAEIQMRMPISGRLFLGINENLVGDNDGAFSVSIVSVPVRQNPSR
jgi:hypothetical protein